MRITFTFQGYVTRYLSDKVIPIPSVLDGWDACEFPLDSFLDTDLAEAGVIGGNIRTIVSGNSLRIQVVYWCASKPDKELLAKLEYNTVAQMSDGAGEGGFHHQAANVLVHVNEHGPIEIEIVDDGRKVPGPPILAMAARDGDTKLLWAEITKSPGDLERLFQSDTALQLAIFGGHIEAVRILLDAGANPNGESGSGDCPLHVCALANDLDDDQSCLIAQMLLDHGADPSLVNSGGQLAKDYALNREKHRLASML